MESTIGKRSYSRQRLLLCLLLSMAPFFTACGMHHNIKGKVIDAQTGKPVEGAVVAINWIRYKIAPPGYPTPKERYGTTEDITDAKGGFTIPKYTIGTHFMGVYKPGYVCWSSDRLFNPQGKDEDEMFVHRWVKVENGMVVELEPKGADFPEVKHASFTLDVEGRVSTSSANFYRAVEMERKLYIDHIDKNGGKERQ